MAARRELSESRSNIDPQKSHREYCRDYPNNRCNRYGLTFACQRGRLARISRAAEGGWRSGEDVVNHMAVHVGQPTFNAVVIKRERLMV